jgi:chemotaxis methyl-accepting protein methylase
MYLRLNMWAWRRLPPAFLASSAGSSYGMFLQKVVRRHSTRRQFPGTFFLRNRPVLELMRRLVESNASPTVKIAVFGCSIGAEVYSVLWTLRSARPELKIQMCAADISAEVLNLAREAVYTDQTSDFAGTPIFERMTDQELRDMFDWEGSQATVKPWLREGIRWHLGDACEPEIIRTLGPQDIVVASNFLCHMEPQDAEKCLRNMAGLVKPGGYLFVSGVELEVRAKVAAELGWRPVPELIEEIHDGDPSVRGGWPGEWWGLEPLDQRKENWQMRYAAVFQQGNRIRE